MSDTDLPPSISPEMETLRAYIRARGLPLKDDFLTLCGIELAGAARIADVLGYAVPHGMGVVINYPDSDYSTVRVVSSSEPDMVGPRCPKGQPVRAYLAPFSDWPTVSGTVVVCESPLKAITWGMYGYNALAAGGVSTVYMARKGKWCEGFPHAAIESGAVSEVLIAWDSDIDSNHDVSRSMRVLARALKERHPELSVKIHPLPHPPEGWAKKSWGVDDAHAHYGPEWFKQWSAEARIRREPEGDALLEHFDELNANYAVSLENERVLNLKTLVGHSSQGFQTLIEGHRSVPGEKDKPIAVAPLWLRSNDRNTVQGKRYLPGSPMYADTREGRYLNTWREGGIRPVKGDVSRWLDMVNDAVADEATRKLMLQCMAYQVQYRERRLEKLLYFVGRQVGTGKTTQAKIMQQILGEHNVGWVNKQDLEGQYNAIWAAKELVVMDDIAPLKNDTWAKFKAHITSDVVMVHEKYTISVLQDNFSTFYITGNRADILATDTEDRRVLMIHWEPTVVHREDQDSYWKDFYNWLFEGPGLSAILHYLGTMNLDDFNPNFFPPVTELKQAATQARLDDHTEFLEEFRHNPGMYIPDDRVVITSTELFIWFSGENPSEFNRDSRRNLAKAATTKSMFKRFGDGNVMVDGKKVTLYQVPGRDFPKVIPGANTEDEAARNRAVMRWVRKNLASNLKPT